MISTIGFYKRISKVSVQDRTEMPIDMFLSKIQNGEWQDDIISLRQRLTKIQASDLSDQDKAKAKQKLKSDNLPYVTISGLFTSRNNSGLSEHSGFLAIDIDDADPQETKKRLRHDRHVYGMFTSCSGNGLCVIFKIHPQKHLASFEGIAEYFYRNYQIVIDQACKDVSRPRYISWDPDTFINDHADEFKQFAREKPGPRNKKPERAVVFIQTEFENIVQELEQRQLDIVGTYQQWLKVAYALADKFREGGREYFHRISQQGSTYTPDGCDRQYDAVLRNLKESGNPATIASFYWICKEAGLMIASETVASISKRAATHKKANSTEVQSVQNIIQFPDFPADPELVADIVKQIYNNDIKIDDVSDIEIGRIWVRNNGVRRNEITSQLHLDKKALTNAQLKTLELKMREDMPEMDRSDISMILESDAVPEFHEIKEFFGKYRTVKGTGSIARLAACLNSPTGAGTDYVERMLTKWLVGGIACLFKDESHTMLVLCGEKMGDGKSYFFKNLLPEELQHLTACKDFSLLSNEGSKRDFEIAITRSWLIYDDEMGGKSKRDHKVIKAMLSKSYTDVRAAYARTEEHRKRIAFFGGTSNDLEILSDHGDNRRIIPIQILQYGIDQVAKDKIDPIDYIMEAYHLFIAKYDYRILKQDIEFLNSQTELFKETVMESELVVKKFRKPQPGKGEYVTGTDIKIILEAGMKDKINPTKIKSAMKELGITQEHRNINGIFGRFYYVEQINPSLTFLSEQKDLPF